MVKSLAKNLSPITAAKIRTINSLTFNSILIKFQVHVKTSRTQEFSEPKICYLLKVAVAKVENPSAKLLDPVIMVVFIPSPTNMILAFSLEISTVSL